MRSCPRGLEFLLFAVVLGTAGCASVPRDAGFTDVARDVEERLGERVAWYRGAPEEAAVEAALDALSAGTLTAEAAVQVALLNNRRLQATYEELGVAQAAVVQAGLLRNPIFGGDVGFPLEGGPPALAFEVAVDFLDVFFLPLRKAVAASAFETAKLRVTGAVLDLAGETRAAYYRLLAARQRAEMLRQVALAAEAAYEAARRLHAAGNIPDLDLHQQQALYEQARLSLVAAEAASRDRREGLIRAMGVWAGETAFVVPDRLPALPEAVEPDTLLVADAIAASLDLAAARQEIETYGRRLGLTETTALIPEFELGGGAEREDGHWKAGPVASFPLPLFDWGQARVAGAHAELRRRQAAYYALGVDVRSAARSTAERLRTAGQVARHHRDVLLPLRARITRETQQQYNAMQIGVFQLLQAKAKEIDAGMQYVGALETYWLAWTDADLLRRGRLGGFGESLSPANLAPRPSDNVSREEH